MFCETIDLHRGAVSSKRGTTHRPPGRAALPGCGIDSSSSHCVGSAGELTSLSPLGPACWPNGRASSIHDTLSIRVYIICPMRKPWPGWPPLDSVAAHGPRHSRTRLPRMLGVGTRAHPLEFAAVVQRPRHAAVPKAAPRHQTTARRCAPGASAGDRVAHHPLRCPAAEEPTKQLSQSNSRRSHPAAWCRHDGGTSCSAPQCRSAGAAPLPRVCRLGLREFFEDV